MLALVKNLLPSSLTGPMARDSGAGLAMRVFATGCGFLFAVAAARLLGPSDYGTVVVAISLATVLATISLIGIDGLAVRESAALLVRNEWGEFRAFIRWSSQTVACASMALGLLMAGAAYLGGPYSTELLLGSIAVPLLAGLHLARGITQGVGRPAEAQLPLEVVRWVLALLLIGLLLLQGAGASAGTVILITLASFAISLLAAFKILRRQLAHMPVEAMRPSRPRAWTNAALPFLTLAVFGIIGTEASTLLLGWLAGPREAGLYQPIAKLAPLMLLGTYSIDTALAPRIVHRWEERDHAGLQRLMRRSAIASTGVAIVITGSILFAAPWILRAFGEEFVEYQDFLYWIAAAQVANASLGAPALLLSMAGSMRQRLHAQAGAVVVQTALGIGLIPTMGAAGAVISMIGSILSWATLHWFLALRTTGIDTSAFGALRRSKNNLD